MNRHSHRSEPGLSWGPSSFADHPLAISLLLVLPSLAVALVAPLLRLEEHSGDGAIYLTYARSAWDHGLFHYGPAGPTHGASSPLWAAIMMMLHPIAGDKFSVYQLASILALLGASCSALRLGRELAGSLTAGLLAGALLAVNGLHHRFAVQGFETALFVLLVTETTLATVRVLRGATPPRLLHWTLVLALLPLGRPEGIAMAALLGGLVSVRLLYKRRVREALLLPLLASLPSVTLYLWMYRETGVLVPSSVTGRAILSLLNDTFMGHVGTWDLLKNVIGKIYVGRDWDNTFAATALVLALLGLGSVFQRSRLLAAALLGPPLLMFAAWTAVNPGIYTARYGLAASGIGVALIATGLSRTFEQLILRMPRLPTFPMVFLRFALLFVAVWGLLFLPTKKAAGWAKHSLGTTMDIVLDLHGSRQLNSLLPENARLLQYEVQAQYSTRIQMISADGIVGGEILPDLIDGSIERFLIREAISHIAVSSAYDYRSIYDGTLLERLWEMDSVTPVGETLELRDFRLLKLIERKPPLGGAHWRSIYEIIGRPLAGPPGDSGVASPHSSSSERC